MSDMDKAPAEPAGGLPPDLRFLKILVSVLTATMIVGLITIVGLLVIRLKSLSPAPTLPANITLPAGERARAVTFGSGWIAVVTDKDQILILDPASGALRQRVTIAPAGP